MVCVEVVTIGPSMSPVDPLVHDRFFLSQRFRPMVNQYEVSTLGDDGKSAGDRVCFVEQKRMKLKEDLRAYGDDSKTTEVFRIKARQVWDPRARYDVTDPEGQQIGQLAKVFGRQLRLDQVARLGIDELGDSEIEEAAATGKRLKHVATLEFARPDGAGDVTARVEPELVSPDDPLARIAGTTNAVVFRANPVREVMVAGPGAGPELAGQGVLSDLIAVARSRACAS